MLTVVLVGEKKIISVRPLKAPPNLAPCEFKTDEFTAVVRLNKDNETES